MAYGEIKRDQRKVAAAFTRSGGHSAQARTVTVKTYIDRTVVWRKSGHGANGSFSATSCVVGSPKKMGRGNSKCTGRYFGRSPTAAMKKSLAALARGIL